MDGKRGKAEKGRPEQQTHFHVGPLRPNTLQAEASANLSLSKELDDAGEKPYSSVISVSVKISMIPLSGGCKAGEELYNDRSESSNAKSVIRLDIVCH